MGNRTLSWLIALALLSACVSGHCRKEVKPHAAPEESAEEKAQADSPKDRVFVFKYDGTVKCGSTKGVSLDDMKEQLKTIKTFSQVKKPDALMHPMVCGSGTGMANVFEISAKDLDQAQRLGFKKWNY